MKDGVTKAQLEILSAEIRRRLAAGAPDLQTAIEDVLIQEPAWGPMAAQLIKGAQDKAEREITDDELRDKIGEISRLPQIRRLSEVVEGLPSGSSDRLLVALAVKSPALAEALKGAAFRFEDLIYADGVGVQKLMAGIDRMTLCKAFRGLEIDLRDHLLSGVSRRNRDEILEGIELLGKTRRSEVGEARQTLVEKARRLLKNGELFLMKPNDPDPYIP